MNYRIEWKDEALESLKRIGDKVKQRKIRDKVENELSKNPYKGEPLKGDFKGLRSFHCLSNKYRVIYQVLEAKLLVVVLEAGWREGFYKKISRKF